MTRGTTRPRETPDGPFPASAGRDVREDEDREDRRLLGRARAGDGGSVASIYDRHAGALLAIARGVLREATTAEDAVVDVVVDACGPGPETPPTPRSVRHRLAVATYHRCAAARPLDLPARSRAVLGLCLHGDHTYREAATLTGVAGAPLGRLLQDELSDRGLRLSA